MVFFGEIEMKKVSRRSEKVEIEIPFDESVFVDVVKMAVMFGIGIAMAMWGLLEESAFSTLLAFVGIAVMFIVWIAPISKALDIIPRDEELVEARRDLDEPKLTVSHPRAIFIVLITIFFGATLIGWLIAFFWSYAPGTVKVPARLVGKPEE